MPNSSTRAALPAAATPPEYTAAGATLASRTPKSVDEGGVQSGGHDAPVGQPQHAGEQPERGEQQARVRAGIADRDRQRRQQQRRAEEQREPARGTAARSTTERRDRGGRGQHGFHGQASRDGDRGRPDAESAGAHQTGRRCDALVMRSVRARILPSGRLQTALLVADAFIRPATAG